MWKPPKRNFNNIQFEKYRRAVDFKFNKLADDLSDCYYNYWKKGLSKPFQEYDVLETVEESKTQFDKLHGLIWLEHEEELEKHHERQPKTKKDNNFEKIKQNKDTRKKNQKNISDFKKTKIKI